MTRSAFLFLLLSVLFASPLTAQTAEKGAFSGLFFGDYYWFANHHNNDIEGNNGFWIRRIYFTYEYEISEAFSTRLRLEMNHDGDFTGDSEMIPSVKDAYLKWENDDHQILAGISSTPTWNLVEEVWGYRSVVKSPLDLYDFGSSRDMGLSFIGEGGTDDQLRYHFFIGNGNGESAEFNEGKKLMLSLAWQFDENLVAEVYGDWNDGRLSDSYTFHIFTAYSTESFDAGILYARQNRLMAIADDLHLDLISVFGNMKFSENTGGFLRMDHMFDPYPEGDDNAYFPFSTAAESTFLVGGFDLALHEQVHLLPSLTGIFYGENPVGVSPKRISSRG